MAVDNSVEFHKKNMKMNKQHYTIFSRFTHGRILKLLQTRGSKIHFNDVQMPKDDYVKMMETTDDIPFNDELENVHFRYGLINVSDMKRDLKYWETLMTSSMM